MSYLEKLADIRTFIFDVDGVLTDSSVYILENGQLLRKMNVRDGYAIKYAIEQKYEVIIITGGNSQGVIKRLQDLGVKRIFSGVSRKLKILEELVHEQVIDLNHTLYMGDDLPDYDCMRSVHLSTCPANAATEIKTVSQYISPIVGGQGCVRDIIEKVLKSQNKWKISDNAQL
jgi:3-deoxy-D-manno-octulosonate 8-phosphate phosphatase (KDO 8-P phosphatase)